jgi:hypothetical protein
VTGRIASNFSGHWNYLPVILEEDVIAALRKSFAFIRDFFEIKDPYRRYDRLLYNLALNGCEYKVLMAKPPSSGGITLPMRSPDQDAVIALDHPRLLTRDDLVRPDQEIQAALGRLRWLLKR